MVQFAFVQNYYIALFFDSTAQNPLEDDDDDDQEAILTRLPDDTSDLENCIRSAQGCMLYSNANLIAQYLASKRSFSQSYDKYLQKIILVVREPVVAIRTRAMKCLANIVEVDQLVLARKDMQMGVQQKLLDTAISVREAAVDLVGKYILSDPELIDQYYEMISQRILVSWPRSAVMTVDAR